MISEKKNVENFSPAFVCALMIFAIKERGKIVMAEKNKNHIARCNRVNSMREFFLVAIYHFSLWCEQCCLSLSLEMHEIRVLPKTKNLQQSNAATKLPAQKEFAEGKVGACDVISLSLSKILPHSIPCNRLLSMEEKY